MHACQPQHNKITTRTTALLLSPQQQNSSKTPPTTQTTQNVTYKTVRVGAGVPNAGEPPEQALLLQHIVAEDHRLQLPFLPFLKCHERAGGVHGVLGLGGEGGDVMCAFDEMDGGIRAIYALLSVLVHVRAHKQALGPTPHGHTPR